jgi:hypothetical protein
MPDAVNGGLFVGAAVATGILSMAISSQMHEQPETAETARPYS